MLMQSFWFVVIVGWAVVLTNEGPAAHVWVVLDQHTSLYKCGPCHCWQHLNGAHHLLTGKHTECCHVAETWKNLDQICQIWHFIALEAHAFTRQSCDQNPKQLQCEWNTPWGHRWHLDLTWSKKKLVLQLYILFLHKMTCDIVGQETPECSCVIYGL